MKPKFPAYVTRYDYWERTGFTEQQWKYLAGYVKEEAKKDFVCSAFSDYAVSKLREPGVIDQPFWKVASGEVDHFPYQVVAGSPVVVSTGMVDVYSKAALKALVDKIQKAGVEDITLLACDSKYPSHVRTLETLWALVQNSKDLPVKIGLSDHSGIACVPSFALLLYPELALVEIHFKASENKHLPDNKASLTAAGIRHMLECLAVSNAVVKANVEQLKEERDKNITFMRKLFTKSAVANQDINSGTILSHQISERKPGWGLPKSRVVGRRVVKPIKAGTLIKEEDLS